MLTYHTNPIMTYDVPVKVELRDGDDLWLDSVEIYSNYIDGFRVLDYEELDNGGFHYHTGDGALVPRDNIKLIRKQVAK